MKPPFPIIFLHAPVLVLLLAAPAFGEAAGPFSTDEVRDASVLELRRLGEGTDGILLVEQEEAEDSAPVTVPPSGRLLAKSEEEPYAPLGIRVGSFLLFPSLEARIGGSDNVYSSAAESQSGLYSRLLPALEFRSDWSRHELRGRVAADHRAFRDGRGDETTGLEAEFGGRVDIRSDLRADLRLLYSLEPESRGDPNVPASTLTPPDVERLRGEGSLARHFGRMRLTLRGALEKNDYDDAVLTDGSKIDNGDRNYSRQEAAIRTSFDLTDRSAIFVEVGANRRRYDRRIDDNGILRGSKGYDVSGGVEFRLSGLLTGEIGAGYQHQRTDEPDLPDIKGLIFRGSLVWQPTALTTVTFTGSVSPEESTLDAAASGARVYAAEVEVAHALRRNLIGTTRLAYSRADYVGSARRNDYLDAGIGIEYLANRWLSFTAEASHLRSETNMPGEDYEENRIEVGMKVSR